MSEALARSGCSIHADRPAAARCPSCRRFFCGECIPEHGGRLVCASCLGAVAEERAKAAPRSWRRPRLAPLLQTAAALALVWALFYYFATFLAGIPDAFHDGTIWE